ncbi:NACHT domain-containing protein [Flavitalea antarctica]
MIKIDNLIEATDQEIGRELNLSVNWLQELQNVPTVTQDKKHILIFDAFDTARNAALRSKIVKFISRARNQLEGNWNIIVTCRLYDAQKSAALIDLFPHKSLESPVGCRTFNVPAFTREEVEEAIKHCKVYFSVYQKSTTELRQLLTIPFFLNLFERLVSENIANEYEIETIQTEEQLLSYYWDRKIEKDSAKEILLHDLTEKLALAQKLTCKKADVLQYANADEYQQLVSDGVLADSSFDAHNTGFRHNIIFDYALSRLFIHHSGKELIEQIRENEKLPFIFRPSYIYYFSRLWRKERSIFWHHFNLIARVDEPLFRLFYLSVLNPVLVSAYRSLEDLSPVIQLSDEERKSQLIKKLLDGLRFINRDQVRSRDIILLHRLSQQLADPFVYSLGCQLDNAVKSLTNNSSKDQVKLVADAVDNYLEHVLTKRKTAINPAFYDANGAQWGIENVCKCYRKSSKRTKHLIKEVLSLLTVEN